MASARLLRASETETAPRRPRAVGRVVRAAERIRNVALAPLWPPYSRLFLSSDGADWVLAYEMVEAGRLAKRIGIKVASTSHALGALRQSVLYANQFVLTDARYFRGDNRYAVAYYHGRSLEGEPSLQACFAGLRERHRAVDRFLVTNRSMRDFLLRAAVEPAKTFVIPIGVDLALFPPRTSESRTDVRRRFDIPASAAVVGSFQKDGVGWGAGDEPKRIKGPDVLVRTMRLLKERVPGLFIVLTGPARGYVRRELERVGVPYRHFFLRDYADVAALYHALDVYVVASREEGGPKAVLESMAAGVPLVTTRVGQAADIVRHGENGWIAEVEDADALAHWAELALTDTATVARVVPAARATAERHSYEAQLPLWRRFFAGFVEVR